MSSIQIPNLWQDAVAATLDEPGLLLYRSNLLGSDLRITNFGGGNTSAKVNMKDPLSGQSVEVLWVKGSGGDIGSMKLDGFSTLYMDKLNSLKGIYRGLAHEDEMVGLFNHCTFNLNPRATSIDTALHGFVPHKHVDHVHADAVIAIAASKNAEDLTKIIYGGEIGFLPWQRPGFDLGLKLGEMAAAHPEYVGVVLGGHGLFTWGDTSKACYEMTLRIIQKAADWLAAHEKRPRFGGAKVAALDAAKGTVKWRVKPLGPLRGSPAVGYGSVIVVTQDNQIAALDATDGKTQWNESGSLAQTGVFGVAAPAVGQGTIVAGYSSGELVAYRYENGRQLWNDALARTSIATSVSIITDIDADPIIDNGRVYALGQGGRMAAYELVTGQRIWELNLAGISTPAIAGEWIFTLTDDDKLLCITKSSGKVRWLSQLPRWRSEKHKKGDILWTGPVLAGNRLWLNSSEGDVATASVDDGKLTRVFRAEAGFTLAPVVANKTLYVLDNSGRITAFR